MVLNGLGVTCLKTGENSLLGRDGVFEDDDSYALPLKKSGICRHFATAVSGNDTKTHCLQYKNILRAAGRDAMIKGALDGDTRIFQVIA